MNMKLDVKDKRILTELCRNARTPAARLAKEVSLSREAVEYRIRRLQRLGIIRKFITSIDVARLGFEPFNVYMRMLNFTDATRQKTLSFLSAHPAVRWLMSCSGRFDIMMRISCRNARELEKIFGEFSEMAGQNLMSFEVMQGIQKIKSLSPVMLFFGDAVAETRAAFTPAAIDRKDIALLRLLSNDACATLISMAKVLKMTPEAVKYRMRSLEKQGVIRSYTCMVDIAKLGYSWYFLLLSVKQLNTIDERKLKEILGRSKKVWFAEKNLGKWNLQLEVLAENAADFNKSLVELRNYLGSNLNDFELLLVFDEHVNEMFPKHIEKTLNST